MKVLSFDVGIRNLAYVHVDVDVTAKRVSRVLHWGNIDLHDYAYDGNASAVGSVVRALLTGYPFMNDPDAWDIVLIENQPSMKNPAMKTVQVAINAFFEMLIQAMQTEPSAAAAAAAAAAAKDPMICLVSARNKVGSCGGSYAERKKLSVQRCLQYVESLGQEDMSRMIEQRKKKDDLCDAFMQAVWFIENKPLSKFVRVVK